MAFKKLSPWEEILFKDVDVPSNIIIPVDDTYAYLQYPNLRWIFNKLELCKSQGIECAPIGVEPKKYPVFMKPITNLYGMGMEAKRIDEEDDINNRPGFFWMEYLQPPHISTDVVLYNGQPKWWGHTLAYKLDDTKFSMWEFRGNTRFNLLEEYIQKWLKDNVGSHTGVFNFETMNGKIIDAHPRMSVQFVDLYGDGWLQAVANLYNGEEWKYSSEDKIGYSAPIWSNDFINLKIRKSKFEDLCSRVKSIQITVEDFYQPPSGFRIAVVNGHDKDEVLSVVNDFKKALEGGDPSWWEAFKIYKKNIEIIDLISEIHLSKED